MYRYKKVKCTVVKVKVAAQKVQSLLYIAVATDVFTKRNRGQITATLNHGSSYSVYDTDSSYEYIQDVSGEKVNILGGDSIGNCQKKKFIRTYV